MTGTVYKLVRFVNILTDISQFFIDIYQSIDKTECACGNQKLTKNKKG
jgi:hypothetical protein